MNFIPVNEPLLNGNEKRYLAECIETGWISSEGPFVERLEQGFASRMNRRHAVAVCNGTTALEAAVVALDLEPGSEVILPTFTIISCAAAVVRAGLRPIFVDCEPETWNMAISGIEKAMSARTRAIMAVHIYGLPVDMDPLLELATRHRLRVIEDASQMIGQTYRRSPCGGFGDISTLSFYPNKHVTTGEGGMILCDDDYLAERARSLRNLCFKRERRFLHDELGYNFRMSNVQAALGVAQLERLDEFLAKKRHVGRLYREMLGNLEQIELQLDETNYSKNLYWVMGVVLRDGVKCDAAEMMAHLGTAGIGTRPFFVPMHEQPVLQKMGLCRDERHPMAERIARRGFYLPSGLALTDDQVERAAAELVRTLKQVDRN